MEKEELKFEEQQAPQKNTDNAFVQVGIDGHPKLPETDNQKESGSNEPQPGTLKDR